MPLPLLVSDLIQEVRDNIEEFNTDNITDAQILAALNKAQRKAINIVNRKYEDAFVTDTTFTTIGGIEDYDLPTDCYGGRVEKLELVHTSLSDEIKRISYREACNYVNSSNTSKPLAWCVHGKKIRLYPTPNAGLIIKVWYAKRFQKLVKEQGRITVIDLVNGYLTVDSLGTDLTTQIDSQNSYFSVIDQIDGDVKATFQVHSLLNNRITIKPVPTRSSVYGLPILTALPTTVSLDDYVCTADGTCISELFEAFGDYLVESASVGLKRRLGESSQEDYIELKDLEEELAKLWVGRENTLRVKKVSRRWANRIRSVYQS